MRSELQEIFEAVREEASRHGWSRGVELARGRAVALEASTETSLTLRVSAPGERVGRSVSLDLDGCDWSCDCPSSDGACMHVAAAVIAAKRAFEEGKAAFTGSMIREETHIQVAVRNPRCILGVFRPMIDS